MPAIKGPFQGPIQWPTDRVLSSQCQVNWTDPLGRHWNATDATS